MCHHIHNLLDSYSKYNNKFSSTCQNAQICDFLRSTQFSRQTHSKIQKINGPLNMFSDNIMHFQPYKKLN